MENIYEELFERKLISDPQHRFLEAIRTNQVVSVYAELRLILFLGILLFTGGVGYFAWQNMGEMGHLTSMFLLAAAIGVGFYFIGKFAKPYSNAQVSVSLVYFDYLLILVSLLIISLFTYVQVYFDLVELLINWTSFISAILLLFMAYRYDHKALLSMGITALAAAVGITISPVDWTKGDWLITSDLYLSSLLLGALLLVVEHILYQREIKKHFRFTFQNFGLLLFYLGGLASIFDSHHQWMYAALVLAVAGSLTYYTWKKKEFLFFLYSNLAAYVAFTYLFFRMIELIGGDLSMLVTYFPLTCIGYIVFLISKKSHFSHD
jgi:hypothetical protein